MHQRTNYVKFSENLWTRALDLKIQVKQTEEKKFLDYFQAVDTECNNSVSYLGICLGLWNPMENYGRYCSNLLRCHTSREQRLIRTFESNAFFTFIDIREQNTTTWLQIAWLLFWSDTYTVNEKILLIYILSLTVSPEQKNQFLYYEEMYYEGMMTPLREIISKWLLGNGNRTTNSLSILLNGGLHSVTFIQREARRCDGKTVWYCCGQAYDDGHSMEMAGVSTLLIWPFSHLRFMKKCQLCLQYLPHNLPRSPRANRKINRFYCTWVRNTIFSSA